VSLKPSDVRKFSHFPKGGSVLGGFDVKEATLDLENQTWFVIFDGKVSRRQAREAMKHFVNKTAHVPTGRGPHFVPIEIRCDEVSTVRSNPSGRVTIAKGHLSFPGVLRNPATATEFHAEMHGMLIEKPEKYFRIFDYQRLNDEAFLDLLWSFVTRSGESYGWATSDGKVYHRRASLIMPKIKINKRPDNEVAFFHTHPSKDEPSLTSADDIQWYVDASFSPGVKHHYTVMRDRIDYFKVEPKKKRLDRYLKLEEERIVSDIDAMIEGAEKKFVGKEKDDVEFCYKVTKDMIDQFNAKFKDLVHITYKQFVNPAYVPNKGDEGPLPNPHPNPLPNPDRPSIPSQYRHRSLDDLKGLDYGWYHYGGDEYAHTVYTYWWMQHYFVSNEEHPKARLWKLEPLGFDSALRKKVRAYLSQRISGNWTYLDMLLLLGLYHDVGKRVEKEKKIHHSVAGKEMWDEFIADALDVPDDLEDGISMILESDVGRRNISEDFFKTLVGDYYGLAVIMQMTDIATHHPYMFTTIAGTFRKAKEFDGDINDFKPWWMAKHVEKLRAFLDEPRKNPRPVASHIKWVGDYESPINKGLAIEALDMYKGEGKAEVASRKQGAPKAYMRFNHDNLPALKGMIPESTDVSGVLTFTNGRLDVSVTPAHEQDDLGRKLAQTIYEHVGSILEGFQPGVKVDYVETFVNVNPRKGKKTRLVIVSGPPGTGKSTFIRYLKKNVRGVGEPLTVTSRPRRPKEKDGVDRIFVSKVDFLEMVKRDEFVEWEQQKNGHYYGRRWVDFNHPINIIDVNLAGVKKYKRGFPHAYTIFLAPDVPPKTMVKRLMRRGGMGLAEAQHRARLGPSMVDAAKKMEWDQFVVVKSGSYDKVFDGIRSKMDDVLENPQMTLFGGTVPEPERTAAERAGDLQPGEASIHMVVTGPITRWQQVEQTVGPNVPVPRNLFAFLGLEALGNNWYKGPEGVVDTARGIRSDFRQRLFDEAAQGEAQRLPEENPGKEQFEWFTEWVHLINMKNKELKAFLDSPLGQKAGLSKEEADEQGIKSGRVSGRRILKMRAKLGLTGPKDYIKLGPRIIEDYYEKALDKWTGPSDDPIKGETDWDWCKRQVRFVKRHGAFPYNADQKGPLVREQKTQNQVSRRLLGLWVWGHDPWRWARKHDIVRMPPCPDVPWIGMTEKRKYGKVEVKMNPWFPSDVSYPSALTDQTISITQLSNPRTPEGKKFPQRYLTGLTPLERMIAEDEIDKGYEYDVNDPEAYEFWKSDIKATARGLKIGPSKHKEEYYRRYRKNIDPDYEPSGDSPKARFINRIAKETGIKRSLIEKVYDKGLAAWRVGHRPGVQQHQWAAGRVYAFVVGADSSTGPGKPDNKIAVEAGVR